MQLVFPKLKEWQDDVYQALEDARGSGTICCVVSKRQVGKTTLATILMCKYACDKPSTICIVEPTLAQSRRVYKSIVKILNQGKLITAANAQLLNIELKNGSEILFRSAEQGDALRGMTLDLMIIDEAAYISDEIFDILYPTVDVRRAPILMISTPLFRDGTFYKTYCDKQALVFDWSQYDTSEFLTDERLEYYRNRLPEPKFRCEYMGQFISDKSLLFGDLSNLICTRQDPVKYIGIDWGTGQGGDSTVVMCLDQNRRIVPPIYRYTNENATEQVALVSDIIKRYNPAKVAVEQNSIGSVYYDFLRRSVPYNIPIEKFVTTNESKRRIVENLIKACQTENIGLIDDAELIAEMQHYSLVRSGNTYTYNGLAGYHDDYVMALAIAYNLFDSAIGGYNISLVRR